VLAQNVQFNSFQRNCSLNVTQVRYYVYEFQKLHKDVTCGILNFRLITGWAVALTCCISQCSKYRKSGIFGYPWEQNPWTNRHETWGA